MKWSHIGLISALLLTACEKTVMFDLRRNEDVLVVDATIETNEPPRVILTKSLNYFANISAAELNDAFIKDAEVSISNGVQTHRLRRYDLPLNNGFVFTFYGNDPQQPATAFVGEEGKTYRLTITWKGKVYRSSTTIPQYTKTLDSLWFTPPPGVPDTSGKVVLYGKFTDPPLFGNYIRYFTSVNGGPFLPGLNSVFDDQFVNGTTYEIAIDRGVNRNQNLDFDDYGFFRRGDTVTVKFSNIDKATYDFWRTVEFSYSSIGNPFATPVRILGNVSNGALGYFGGYANRFHRIVIPR